MPKSLQNFKNIVKIKDVLYQKMGSVWYLFLEDEGEVYYTPLPDGIDPLKTPLELNQIIEIIQRSNDLDKQKHPEEML